MGLRYCLKDLPAEDLSEPLPRRRGLPRATADQSGVIRVGRIPERSLGSISTRPVMLVQVGASPRELQLTRMSVAILEVRCSLPALTRIRVTRPQLIVVGETVSKELVPLLRAQAHAIGADILELHQFVPVPAVGPWVKDTLARIANRQRAASAKAAPPSASIG